MNKTKDLKPQITTYLERERERERTGFFAMVLERERERELGFQPRLRERGLSF